AVGLSLCDSAPLLWRMEDLRSARARGLVGALLGSLPRTPRQNLRLGRPLLLLPEEERLLSEEHAAAALPAHPQAAAVELKVRQREEEQQRSYQEQRLLALEDRKSALLRATTPPSTGESRDLWRNSRNPAEVDVGGAGSGAEAGEPLAAAQHDFRFPASALAVQLSTARAGLSHCAESRASLRAHWPVREHACRSSTRYQVFRDLRRRGFFLTSAGKFGGDFLVYPGDPLRFHAHFIAVCLPADECVCLLDVLAVARLGSNVKKTVLLCSPGPDADLLYTSLQWSGMV
uniref:tRNA-splicing endonuclease subunit Sen34 n=1 Tax=Tetraodon nigroviridis TaxID=99883 RepID=H3C7V5_TETNG